MNTEHENLTTLSARLTYAIDLIGTKKADLARAINVKPQIIQFLCTGNTQTSRFTFEIATALGLNTRWLATGEGTMFAADDPIKQFLKTYKKVPLLPTDDMKTVFLLKNPLDESKITKWLLLQTECEDVFAIIMPDTSMEPIIPSGSHLFVKQCDLINQDEAQIIIAYLKKYDTFVVRTLVRIASNTLLIPKNTALFKEVEFNEDVIFLGVVTDCFWHLRN